jgi:hypothetical protein
MGELTSRSLCVKALVASSSDAKYKVAYGPERYQFTETVKSTAPFRVQVGKNEDKQGGSRMG